MIKEMQSNIHFSSRQGESSYKHPIIKGLHQSLCNTSEHPYTFENNIASDIRLSRNVVNKESKRSQRFVCYCDTLSGDKNYCKQGSFILYGRTGGAVYNSIDNWKL